MAVAYDRAATRTAVGGGAKITFTSRLPQRGHVRRLPSLPRGKRSPFAQTSVLHVEFGRIFAPLKSDERFDGAADGAGADAPTEPVGLPEGLG